MITLSYTQLDLWLGCPAAYGFKYILKLPQGPDPYHFPLGSATHKAMEETTNHRIATGEWLALDAALAAFDAEWARLTGPGREINWMDGIGGYNMPPEQARQMGLGMVEALHTYTLPDLGEPVAAEQKIYVPIPGHPGYQVVAIIDLMTKKDGVIVPGDWKTVAFANAFSQKKADGGNDKITQAAFYAWVLREAGYDLPEPAPFQYHCVTKPRGDSKAYAYTLETSRTAEQVAAVPALLHDLVVARDGERYRPDPTYKYHKYCAFAARCPKGAWSEKDIVHTVEGLEL